MLIGIDNLEKVPQYMVYSYDINFTSPSLRLLLLIDLPELRDAWHGTKLILRLLLNGLAIKIPLITVRYSPPVP